MFHLIGDLHEWGNTFGARRAVFISAAKNGAHGVKGSCITHFSRHGEVDSIHLDVWFHSEQFRASFTAALYEHPTGNNTSAIRLEMKRSPPPKGIQQVLPVDYEKDVASPEQCASTGDSITAPAATNAAHLREALKQQRLDQVHEKGYQNMHIVPVALLDDARKLTCNWLFFSGSPTFHHFFDGPDTAPHIQVTFVEQNQSSCRRLYGLHCAGGYFQSWVEDCHLEA